MKKMHTSLQRTAGVCTGLAAALALSASAAETGLYFNAEAGVNFAQDADISSGGVTVTAESDPGFRASVGVGYNFTKYLGVEFETGWIWNEVNNTEDFLASGGGDISAYHVPYLVNVVFRFPNKSKFVPYVGGGVGGTYSIVNVDTAFVSDTDGDFVFAWQAMAGVRYMFKENMSIGAGYKYHGTADASYTVDGVDFESSNVHNHSFSVVFQMTF